jgi:hypothetical protein
VIVRFSFCLASAAAVVTCCHSPLAPSVRGTFESTSPAPQNAQPVASW